MILVTYHRMLSDRRRATAQAPGAAPAWEEDGIGEGGALDAAAGGAVAASFLAASAGLVIADECHMVNASLVYMLQVYSLINTI